MVAWDLCLCVGQVLYASTLVRAVIALHQLVSNKIEMKAEEEKAEAQLLGYGKPKAKAAESKKEEEEKDVEMEGNESKKK